MSELFGAGLGLRREMLDEFVEAVPASINFLEVAPENWMALGGEFQEKFAKLTAEHKFVTHGLSLSLGSPDPLDTEFVKQVGAFLDKHNISIYSEHLSYCSGNGHLYDLLPIPFTKQAADYTADRIMQVQDILQRRMVIENVSYYAAPGQQMDEIEFLTRVLDKADCDLLLDVNNIYVNSVNHGYDADAFLAALPTERICYGHIAGHYNEAEDLIVDTHGADVIDSVWQLLDKAYAIHGVFPTLLERDFNIPATSVLVEEVERINQIQRKYQHEDLSA